MHTDPYSLSSYDYVLPEPLIAKVPVEPRDSSRLLVLDRASGKWQHRVFRELPGLLNSNDVLVANNTRVLKARLLGRRLLDSEGRLGGKVEFLLLREISPRVWEGAFHASAKHRPGVGFQIPIPAGGVLCGKIIRGASESAHGTVVAEFDQDPLQCGVGVMPLPPYIDRESQSEDEQTYQTVYASHDGSAAAPTAGLHFTPNCLNQLRANGVEWAEITLQVGLGTFRPVKTSDIRAHEMHEEYFEILPEVAQKITQAKQQNKRIVAVGTTSVRTLESAWVKDAEGGRLQSGAQKTSLFIHPGECSGHHRFQVVDALITNFHLPRSTLLMLVCAFAGRELVLEAYQEAIREKYRFYSYGDAMLIV